MRVKLIRRKDYTQVHELSEDQWKEVAKDYKGGMSQQKIAKKWGVGKATIQRILKNRRVKSRTTSEAGKIGQKGRGVNRKLVVRKFLAKVPPEEIAQELGISVSRVGQIIREEGLSAIKL
jgi:DNA invertase Pin-like site-specific DNA recombinase